MKTQTFSKSKQGTPGAPGNPGNPGNPGDPGATGAQVFIIYIRTESSSTVPTVGATSNVGAVPSGGAGSGATTTVWQYTAISPVNLSGSQAQWQSDGTAPAGSSTVTWSTPYLSYFKVGSLSAITADLGSITAGSVVIGAPVLTGTKITSGTGTRLNSDGTFAAGGATSSIVGTGSAIYLNGEVISTGNITANAVTKITPLSVISGGTSVYLPNFTTDGGNIFISVIIKPDGVHTTVSASYISLNVILYLYKTNDINYYGGSFSLTKFLVPAGLNTSAGNTWVRDCFTMMSTFTGKPADSYYFQVVCYYTTLTNSGTIVTTSSSGNLSSIEVYGAIMELKK